ncbi:MAG: LysE family transporter [Hyphomicrobiales bacterium]
MGVEALVPFAAFWLVAIFMPGPNTLLFTWIALSQPRDVAVATVAGILSCTTLWGLAGLFGLIWATARFPSAYHAVKMAGGLYLVWRGGMLLYGAVAGPGVPWHVGDRLGPLTRARAFRLGFLTNLSNAKSFAFVTSLFASTQIARGPLWLGLTGVALMVAMSACWYATLLVLFGSPAFVDGYRRARRLIEGVAGTIFMALGTEMAFGG